MPGVIIILHLRTTNDNHDVWFLIYQAEYITTDSIFVIFGHFLTFYPLTAQKMKISEK